MASENAVAVKMSDGREVAFAGKRQMLKEILVGAPGEVSVRFDFRNGETRTYPVPKQHYDYAAGHGLAQKLGDYVAGMKDEQGNAPSVEDLVIGIEEIAKSVTEGDWNAKRASGETGFAGTSILLQAVVEFTGQTMEKVKVWLGGKSSKEKSELRKSPELFPIVQRLEAEKAAKTTSAASALGELVA